MKNYIIKARYILPLALLTITISLQAKKIYIPNSTHNLLLEAEVSGNLASYHKGLRGEPRDVIYDVQSRSFVHPSPWHEYGVAFDGNIGVVPEDKPAWWMAKWPSPVKANIIIFTGAYPNQPQPDTAWIIEIHRQGKWITHARGVGGWYNNGHYVWGGLGTEPITFDALRVSLFSKDNKTPLKSIHFHGEDFTSWIIGYCPPIDARIQPPQPVLRCGQAGIFTAIDLFGRIKSWSWSFGDGNSGKGRRISHTFREPGAYKVTLTVSDGSNTAAVSRTINIAVPIAARITPLNKAVMVDQPVHFSSSASTGKIMSCRWTLDTKLISSKPMFDYRFVRPGIYKIILEISDGTYRDKNFIIVRVHTNKTRRIPQVFLDTDQKNEQDDQHYLGYALFSELDVLGVNSIHHGGGQEPTNYAEIIHIIDLAKKSGLPGNRVPFVFHGADQRLAIPPTGKWYDTIPIITPASRAILAAARGAAPDNPVWVVPVGPGTNVASAILLARYEGLDLKNRIRIMWLGGNLTGMIPEFNANNDPWSMYVVMKSGLECWVMPAPVGARVSIDKRREAYLYADNPLGRYLKKIVPANNKPLYDPAALASIISLHLKLGWIKQTEFIRVSGPDDDYRWMKSSQPGPVRLILQIDQEAMKQDIFNTMKNKKHHL